MKVLLKNLISNFGEKRIAIRAFFGIIRGYI